MTLQEHVVQVTEEAVKEFFRYAHAVPADKLEWKPLNEGQSVLSMTQEIAKTPDWAYDVMTNAKPTDDDRKAQFEEMKTWSTVDQCQCEFENRFSRWADLIVSFPEERFTETVWLPYNGGRDHTFLELFEYPRWNATYHLGQVAYIQTLFGDREMY